MDLMTLDFKNLLVYLLFFFGTCHQMSETVSVTAPETTSITLPSTILPKDEDQKNYENVATKLTLILLGNDKIYAYEGVDVKTGSYYQLKTIRDRIKQSQKKFSGKDFVVIIKPSIKASYANTVDILDEMTINKVERYSIVDLTEDEKQF